MQQHKKTGRETKGTAVCVCSGGGGGGGGGGVEGGAVEGEGTAGGWVGGGGQQELGGGGGLSGKYRSKERKLGFLRPSNQDGHIQARNKNKEICYIVWVILRWAGWGGR